MEYLDTEAVSATDVSPFVTYMTTEFQQDDDDGTDLPLPDISSLVAPTPSPGRRGPRGRPLRDTLVRAESTAKEPVFSDGPDISAPEGRVGTPDDSPGTTERSRSPDGQIREQKPKKHRQGRRSRRGSPSGHTRTSATSVNQFLDDQETDRPPEVTQPGASLMGAQAEAEPDAHSSNDNASDLRESQGGKPGTRKRRRRRRNPKKKIDPEAVRGNQETDQPTSTGGSDS